MFLEGDALCVVFGVRCTQGSLEKVTGENVSIHI